MIEILTIQDLDKIVKAARGRIPEEVSQARFVLAVNIIARRRRRVSSAEIGGIMEDVVEALRKKPAESAPAGEPVATTVVLAEQVFNDMVAHAKDRQANFPKQGLISGEDSWELVRGIGGYYYLLQSRISFPSNKLFTPSGIIEAALVLSRQSYDINGPQTSDDRAQMTVRIGDLAVDAHFGYTNPLALLRARNQRGVQINNLGEADRSNNAFLLDGHPRETAGSDREKWGFALSDNREGRERLTGRLEAYLRIKTALVGALPLVKKVLI